MDGKAARSSRVGVELPTSGGGEVSTTEACKAILSAAVEATNPDAAAKVRGEKAWRQRYGRHLVGSVAQGASDAAAAVKMARAGIEYAEMHCTFTRGGETVALHKAVEAFAPRCAVSTATVHGTTPGSGLPDVPLGNGVNETGPLRYLSEKKFFATAKRWAAEGVCEGSALSAWEWVYANPAAWRTAFADTVFVVCGAGAAMGPLVPLLRLGATVAALDLPRQAVYDRLAAAAKATGGTLHAPVLQEAGNTTPGCNLTTDIPEIVAWLADLAPGKRLVIGQYAYADGGDFMRLSMAQDAVAQAVIRRRGAAEVALAYLCSPTDSFVVPKEARVDSVGRYAAWNVAGAAQVVINGLSRGAYMQPNYPAATAGTAGEHVVNCFVDQQGPNYAMAKRLQHWRCVAARAEGVVVSTNVAPAANTKSVTKNKLLAAGYGGAQFFPPLWVFPAETANHVMALSLLHDLFNTASKSHRAGGSPNDLFAEGAVHSGMWRAPYRLGSILETTVAAYYLNSAKYPLAAAGVAAYAYRAKL
eukprot:TRINITY_DN27162_c0_g1_i1.p1 TRINITY_DN27162_c0_g1~~TRINITY_DN27162_c0_g1_i1.p1  ORF type:complete len:546 (+),score=178.03 TRINITY_DN27162_c0_g1_i1:49-1638(+)